VNKEIVKMQRVTAPAGQQQLQRLLQTHLVRMLHWSAYAFLCMLSCLS
jgi:hypothetical protein